MNKALIQMIQSYPETYSDKEIVKLVFAEAGQVVNEEQVRYARALCTELPVDDAYALIAARMQDRRKEDPRLAIYGRVKTTLSESQLDEIAKKLGVKLAKKGA